ncbi:hypothetical protein [Streptomyces chilikensis]|uniref:Uncharacterized protein n=1 Tax=Streptomyces chilikensis TaxID=1194079 RepID=A0ABV3EK36_9ACTN
MRPIEREIARYDWGGMLCGCGDSAEHVARDLLRTADGHGPEPAEDGLEQHVWCSTHLWEPAPAVAAVALAALTEELPDPARAWYLDLLHALVAGEGSDFGSARRGLDLPELCRDAARRELRLLHGQVMSHRSPRTAGSAFEILTVVEPDRERLRRLRGRAAGWLPVCCRTGSCDDEW